MGSYNEVDYGVLAESQRLVVDDADHLVAFAVDRDELTESCEVAALSVNAGGDGGVTRRSAISEKLYLPVRLDPDVLWTYVPVDDRRCEIVQIMHGVEDLVCPSGGLGERE